MPAPQPYLLNLDCFEYRENQVEADKQLISYQ